MNNLDDHIAEIDKLKKQIDSLTEFCALLITELAPDLKIKIMSELSKKKESK